MDKNYCMKKITKTEKNMILDDKFHEIYKSDAHYQPTLTDVRCRVCGTRLKVYHAEEQLYVVKCGFCEYIALVKANNPTMAMRYFGEYVQKEE